MMGRMGSLADVYALPLALRHQAWFIAYAPAENPTIALVVLVENGGHGSSAAAPIARIVFDYWLLGKAPDGTQPKVNTEDEIE